MKVKNLFWIIIVAIAAFVLAGVGATFSVYGLTKVFPAGWLTFVLFGILEFAKIVMVSIIYRFWKITKKFQRIYLIFATVVLMAVTSAGIYGFLTNAYQKTSNELTIIDSQSQIVENKKEYLVLERTRYEEEIESKNNQINTYISNRTGQEKLVSDLYNKSLEENQGVYRNRAKETQDALKNIDLNINKLRDENNILYNKINVLNDSIGSLDRQLIEIQNTDFSAEIGPLRFIAKIVNVSMDKFVNWLALIIVLVFDPLAIMLIIILNQLIIHSGWEPFAGTKPYKRLKEQEEKEKEKEEKEKEEKEKEEKEKNKPEQSQTELTELLKYFQNKDQQDLEFKESMKEQIKNLQNQIEHKETEVVVKEVEIIKEVPVEIVKEVEVEVVKEVPVVREVIKEVEVEKPHSDIQRVTTNINKSTFIPNK